MTNNRIKDMAASERPYEKTLEFGIGSLSDAELLALLLRSGTKDVSAIELAQTVLNAHPTIKGLPGLNYMSVSELTKIKGVGKVKACQILAITEISKRMSRESFKPNITFNSPSTVADYFMEECRYKTVESVFLLYLNSQNAIIKWKELSTGTVNASLLSPRELFLDALKNDAVSLILLHNHPSGNPCPSDKDIVITERIRKLGEELGIKLLDHIIIGDKKYYSFSEEGLI